MRKLLFLAVAAINLTIIPTLGVADAAPTNPNAILIKTDEVKFHPAPGFPKGAQIVLLRGDLSQPEPYTLRLKLPNGYVIPAHWHSTDEEVTVLSGTLNVGLGDKVDKAQSTALAPGGFQLVPANAHHYVWATGETVIQLDGMGPRTTVFVDPQEWSDLIKKSLVTN